MAPFDRPGHGGDDFARIRALLIGLLTADTAERVDLPHAVACVDLVSGSTTYTGPYENGLAALCAAERDHQESGERDDRIVFSVVPLDTRAEPRG